MIVELTRHNVDLVVGARDIEEAVWARVVAVVEQHCGTRIRPVGAPARRNYVRARGPRWLVNLIDEVELHGFDPKSLPARVHALLSTIARDNLDALEAFESLADGAIDFAAARTTFDAVTIKRVRERHNKSATRLPAAFLRGQHAVPMKSNRRGR